MRMVDATIDSATDVGANLFFPRHPRPVTNFLLLAYLLPNDETENDRLDMMHEMFLVLLHRKLYLAPIKHPQRVMDLGTGTGIWAIDFGAFACWI